LTDVNTGNGSVWLSPSTTHTSLQSIGTSARQHLVDTDDVIWVGADTKMEILLSSGLDEVPEMNVRTLFCHYALFQMLMVAYSRLMQKTPPY
jgi:hypothetical protein